MMKKLLYSATFATEDRSWLFSVHLEHGITLRGDSLGNERVPLMSIEGMFPLYPSSLELSLKEFLWLDLCWETSRPIWIEHWETLEKANLQYTEHIREIQYDLWDMLNLLNDHEMLFKVASLMEMCRDSSEDAVGALWAYGLLLDEMLAEYEENQAAADDEIDEEAGEHQAYNDEDRFTHTATDGHGGTDVADVTTISAVNDDPLDVEAGVDEEVDDEIDEEENEG